jgi:hypothetical protein
MERFLARLRAPRWVGCAVHAAATGVAAEARWTTGSLTAVPVCLAVVVRSRMGVTHSPQLAVFVPAAPMCKYQVESEPRVAKPLGAVALVRVFQSSPQIPRIAFGLF